MQSAALASAAAASPKFAAAALSSSSSSSSSDPLSEFSYSDVTLHSDLHERQRQESESVLMQLSEDSLLKPYRQMAGQPAPGEDLGGWYDYNPHYDWHSNFDAGFAPGSTLGQWISALSRDYAIGGSPAVREKVLRLNRAFAQTISGDFYEKTRFPGYTYDKMLCGLMDSQKFAGDPEAWAILQRMTDTALPHLPTTAIEHGQVWRPGTDESFTWDESYTMSENLFLASQRGAGDRYKKLAIQFIDDEYFGPLAEGHSNFAGQHAYSHVNALCSAMQAYFALGSEKHLRAAKNGFDFLTAQSFATGGWGPDETLNAPDSTAVYDSLTKTHNSFETPCGSYAHFKLTRYLLRATRDPRYGDSMERMMYNTILGVKPLQADGRAFYYSDYNVKGRKVYSKARWPCCSGTLPQVVADYRINTYFKGSRENDEQGVYVNLYIPSTVRWTQGGAQIELTQKELTQKELTQRGAYPFEEQVQFEVKASRSAEFDVNLRIPAWAEGASISVNGKRQAAAAGSFANVRRQWKTGDRIELELPMKTRLEAIDARHPETAALMVGPLVLLAITDSQPAVTRAQLLAAKKIGPRSWEVATSFGAMKMLPFTEIQDEQYATYLRIG
jgi:uncharacterized protein